MIFRRKKPGGGDREPPRGEASASAEGGPPPLKSFARPGSVEGPTKPLASMPPKAPVPPTTRSAELPRRIADIPNAPRKVDRPASASAPAEGKKLIVGRDICLNGQISACERLVVEGQVEADLTDCRIIEIADSGTFKGSAEVDSAEISGRFEGSLTVHERLLIRGTGRVTGTIRYGRLEIEQGGEVNGDVKSRGNPEAAARREASAENTGTGPAGGTRPLSTHKEAGVQGAPVGASDL